MNIGFTRRFYIYLSAGFLLLPLVAIDGRLLAALAAYDLVLIGISMLDLLLLPAPENLSMKRVAPKVVFLGKRVEVVISVANKSGAKLCVDVADEPPDLLGETDALVNLRVGGAYGATARYSAAALFRGEGSFGPLSARYSRPYGLGWRQFTAGAAAPISVLPDLSEILKSVPGSNTPREGERSTRASGTGSEFDQMRQYQAGDDPRKLDWKATARARRLMVRQYRADRNREVVFILETGRAMAIPWGIENRFDAALGAVLTVSRRALDTGDRVRVFGVGEDVVPFPAARLRRDFPALVRRLNALSPSDVEPHRLLMYAQLAKILSHRSLIILFIDLSLVPKDALWMATMRLLRSRHRVLLVHMSDPALREERRLLPVDPAAASVYTVAGWFLEKERRALKILRAEGIKVLVARPGRLATDLVNQYESLRDTGWF